MDSSNIDDILDAAARLFAEHGYDGIGIREIARVSGTPAPSIYYHFKSKQELYHEASARKYEEAFERVSEAMKDHVDANVKLEILAATLFDLFLEDRILFLLMQRDIIDTAVLRSRSVMKSHYRNYLQLLEKLLSMAFGKPVGPRGAFTVAALILGYCELSTITEGVTAAGDASWYAEQKTYLCSLLKHAALLATSV